MKLSDVLKAEFNIYRKSSIVKSLLIITFSFSILFGFITHVPHLESVHFSN